MDTLHGTATERLASWRKRGLHLRVQGESVFVVDTGSREAPCLLFLHGFPSSSLDFHRVLEAFSERYRVVVHDHLGFGLSAKPAGYSYSLMEQADVALNVWRQLGIRKGHLVAHDYGTSIATELLARRQRGLLPIELDSVTLSNGSVLLELARLRLSQRLTRSPLIGPLFARLVRRSMILRVLRGLWGDPERADPADLEAMWLGMVAGDGRKRLTQVSRYLGERIRFRDRWFGALKALDLPALILWGDEDPVAVPAIAEHLERAIPGAELCWLPGVGHYPMLEAPEEWSTALLSFLAQGGPF